MSDQQDYNTKKKRRRLKKSVRRFLVLLVALAIMLGLSFVITGIIQGGLGAGGSSEQLLFSSSQPPAGDASVPEDTGGGVVTDGEGAISPYSWNFVGPVEQNPAEMSLVTPDYRMLAVPENGRVDMRYFDTSVFVGDSITQGLEIYAQGIPNAHYCAYKSVSPKAIYDGSIVTNTSGVSEVPLDALAAYNPDNVYVLLGTNAMVAMSDEALLAYYSDMLDAMRARLGPVVDIYVQSITPTLQKVDYRFGKERIAGLNDQLARMAWEKGMYFIDLHEALAGDDGWLRNEFGAQGDGYHLTPTGYTAWVEYLVTHTIYKPQHAHLYLEGSAYYSQLPKPEEPPAA